MRSFLIDTNVLLDFLADRKPFSDHAEALFEMSLQKKMNNYVSAISFNNLYYIMNKVEGHKKAIRHLTELEELVTIVPIHTLVIQNALKSSFSDFQDAIQYYSALSIKNIEGIITRNSKDFKKSDLPVVSPEIAIKLLDF